MATGTWTGIVWYDHGADYKINFAVVDDDGHVLRRGERTAVSRRTFGILTREPYATQVTPVPPLVRSVSRLVVVYIPVALVAGHFFGYTGVYVATALVTVLFGILGWRWNAATIDRMRPQIEIENPTQTAA